MDEGSEKEARGADRGRPVRNLLLRVAYDGTDFYGWQIQPQRPTIQAALTAALEAVCAERVHLHGAGRTDAGVHASAQAASVQLVCPIPCSNLVQALNEHLPESVRVLSAEEMPPDFHARRDARGKIYCYRIFRAPICPPWLSRYVYPFPYPLEERAMEEAALYFLGTQDFHSFASADSSLEDGEKSFVRTIFSSVLERREEELIYTVKGSGFLHHMIRNLVGTLLGVGRKRIPPEAIRDILAARSRSAAGITAPARGLHLVRVLYGAEYGEEPNPFSLLDNA